MDRLYSSHNFSGDLDSFLFIPRVAPERVFYSNHNFFGSVLTEKFGTKRENRKR